MGSERVEMYCDLGREFVIVVTIYLTSLSGPSNGSGLRRKTAAPSNGQNERYLEIKKCSEGTNFHSGNPGKGMFIRVAVQTVLVPHSIFREILWVMKLCGHTCNIVKI